MVYDLELYLHKEWLGLLQPIGLVVSPPALVKSQAFIDSVRAIELQQRLQALVSIEDDVHCLKDFAILAEQILDWLPEDLVKEIPTDLEVVLPDYGETLKPTYAVRDSDSERWIILIQEITTGLLLDEVATENAQGWKASYQDKFERLLRETQIPVGILFNGVELRLVYAPRGESSGYIVFPIRAMTEVSGRLIVGALDMLVGADRLFNVPTNRRLPKILSDSRDYQAEVSTKLASQVLDALWELLRGFQAADDLINGGLLQKLAKDDPQHIYGGLITTLMRLVFLLYAEDEGLMPDDTVYQQNYAVSGLYERLREDAGNYPDTMEQRYGAWTWLLSLFRLVYNGGGNTPNYLPARHGQLFDPDEYPFLEGRSRDSHFHRDKQKDAPRISDDTVYHILENLLILDGEKLSYRALDVEQIGSVYEEIMGFEVKVAQGSSIAIRPKDVVVNIEAILAHKPTDRAKQLKNEAECNNLSSKEASAVKDAKTAEDLLAALNNKVSSRTPNLLPIGSLFLQPGQERRSTGSHYTPRKLTQPIVETTLRPVLEGLGEFPTAEQLLNLKVCDLAMGSGAFLVEACRQLSEKVLEAWTRENSNLLTADVEPLLAARRLVAQRCLYGVDKNPFAVNLAKLSLWLVTLAKDRPFTFVDHALKCGDSLVGMTRKEIESFGRDTIYDSPLLSPLKKHLENAKSYREEIQAGDTQNNQDDNSKHEKLDRADAELTGVRIVGNVAVAAFFDASTKKEREEKTKEYESQVRAWRNDELYDKESQSERLSILEAIAKDFSQKDRPLKPFNWEIEFPEVFDRENPGFDAIVGNPPFAGKNTTINGNPEGYLDWLKIVHPESHGNSDLVAHFFRRAFNIIRQKGTLGLIATNTIAQGDTRSSGLRFICNNKGTIYNAQKRLKWPGLAAVVVSVVNIFKGQYEGVKFLDGKETQKISAFLFHAGGNDDPKPLLANESKSFQGSIVLGMGFTFDDTNSDASSIEQMQRLIEKDPRNQECIFPYIGGEEVNSSPTHSHHRYVINFGEMSEDEARNYPDLMAIVEEKVKGTRGKHSTAPWWQFERLRGELFKAIAPLERVLVTNAQASTHLSFIFYSPKVVFANSLNVFPLDQYSSFVILQSRIHEIWARFFGSSLGDGLRYNPSDCFVTFPFPLSLNPSPTGGRGTLNDLLEDVGREYYEFRAQLMVSTGMGLTQTYNRFHNPGDNSPEIVKLRQLHQQMDEAVLEAYGWGDIDNTCGFMLEYCDLDTEELPEQIRGRVESGDLFFKSSKEAQEFVYWIDIGKRKGLPWRYRWPEAIHDEVLARLLDLNQKRAEEEILSGLKAQQREKTTKKPKAKKTAKGDEGQMGLFSSQE